MKIGCWIHDGDGISIEDQIGDVSEYGIQSVRSYDYKYAATATPALKRFGMSLFAGLFVDSEALLNDWRSQIAIADLEAYHKLGVPLEAICVGNELREGGDRPSEKRFSARLSSCLVNVMGAYRQWLDDHHPSTPLTYAMESIVFDDTGSFLDWIWPLIDVCDSISLNAYPMNDDAWFTFGAFEESRHFLCDESERRRRLEAYESQLRRSLEQCRPLNKPVILSEAGFPSAVGYRLEGDRLVVPESDNQRYAEAMFEFVDTIRRVNADFEGQIRALYFYEWRDNLHHAKIWNVEQSPIHVAFGLCDRFGAPKFDLHTITSAFERGSHKR